MKKIIFVDDEPMVLTGLRRMLRGLHQEWDMRFLPGGKEALTALAESPCDVIVSDMRMAGMDGVELLTEVKKRHPNTVRIALSGHADMELVLECIGATHQYLSKPCDAETVKATIDRACTLRNLLNDEALQTLVTEMGTLPSLPTLYTDIMQAVSDGRSLSEIGAIIAQDVAMTAEILKVVNSAFFGVKRHIASPEQAASVLGLDIVRSLVLSAKVFSDSGKNSALNLESLWQHSSQVGALASRIAKEENQPKKIVDLSQMAGMLHDVGKIVLSAQFTERYREVVALQRQSSDSLWRCEDAIFGQTHMDVGAYLLGLWGLPNPIVEAAAFHHCPGRGAGSDFSPLTAVYLANKLLNSVHPGGELEQIDFDESYLSRLQIEPRQSWLQATMETLG